MNRYSYVWNNPLNATDPSGFTTRAMTPSQLSGDPEELDEGDIEETITYGYWTDFSDFNDSVSDNSYSVEWSGDGDSRESSSEPSRGLYGNGNAQKAHELAELLWPGYDFGTCLSQGGCSPLTWGVATNKFFTSKFFWLCCFQYWHPFLLLFLRKNMIHYS